jgi:hypothetical protein
VWLAGSRTEDRISSTIYFRLEAITAPGRSQSVDIPWTVDGGRMVQSVIFNLEQVRMQAQGLECISVSSKPSA